MEETYPNVDLTLYLIIILEILPYLLLMKSSTNINLLKNLRLNLLHLINNLNGELKKLNSSKFQVDKSTIFLILVKKLINLNDLLITFIKLINRDSSKAMMSHDIENFLKINSQTIKMDDDDSNFLFNFNTTSMGEVNFSFKNDILSNDLIYTLIGYNFDPNVNSELRNSISMNFINEEINIIDEFFKNDLLNFLNTDYHTGLDDDDQSELGIDLPHPKNSSAGISWWVVVSRGNLRDQCLRPPTRNTSMSDAQAENKRASSSGNEAVLTLKEMAKLNSLISLIDKRLLSNQFKSKYPILMYNNCITYILNDILKYIFLKQQQQQLQSASAAGGSANTTVGDGPNDTQQDPSRVQVPVTHRTTVLATGGCSTRSFKIEFPIRGPIANHRLDDTPRHNVRLGASWFHDCLKNPLLEKAKLAGSNVEYYFDDGKCVYLSEDNRNVEQWRFESALEELVLYGSFAYSEDPAKSDLSVKALSEEYVAKHRDTLTAEQVDLVLSAIRMWAELWHGESWDLISGKYFFGDMGHLGRNAFVKNGYRRVFVNELKELPRWYRDASIKFNAHVTNIDYANPERILITLKDGRRYTNVPVPEQVKAWDYPGILINYQAVNNVPSLIALTQNPLSKYIEDLKPEEKAEKIWSIFKPVISQISNTKGIFHNRKQFITRHGTIILWLEAVTAPR
ncbi:RFX-like DNA-binding protein RFX2 [Candida viswanathii]|uniref:RFX-like DNA-binding protein RFX2 n=1 Tax=Candida viswanathii TaxID=5486 RepID=A0A367Y0H4_9ASCO|nr:RFX-like DNA-binding protein RFX2 [Candida viswanathii]